MIGISVGEEVRAKLKPDELKLMVCFKVGLSNACDVALYNKIPPFFHAGHLAELQVHCSSSNSAQFAKAWFFWPPLLRAGSNELRAKVEAEKWKALAEGVRSAVEACGMHCGHKTDDR